MLSRLYRLQKKDIERLYKKGSMARLDSMLIRFLRNRTDHPRFAVVIPKKTLSKATQRNRARRVIYDFLGAEVGLGNLDIAFFLRNFDETQIKAQIKKALEKIR